MKEETLVSSRDYEKMKSRAETAEAVLADVLAEIEGVEQPQLSIGKKVWWWKKDAWMDFHLIVSLIISIGNGQCALCRMDPSNHITDFHPPGELFFSLEDALENMPNKDKQEECKHGADNS